MILGLPTLAHAHGAGNITPENWPAAWNADPLVILNVLVLGALYLRGWRRLRRRSSAFHGLRLTAFMTGLGLVVLALLSPLDALSEELSSVHMVQHTLLMAAAAPLFVAAAPGLVLLHGLDRATRRLIGSLARRLSRLEMFGWLGQPLGGWLVFAVTLWTWHLPFLYEAALQDPWVHDVQHLMFFGSACLFWRVLLDRVPARRLSGAAAVFYLFTTSLHAAALGVFMTLSPRPWYPAYAQRTPAWGLTPLEDQQLAGLIMWMPACLIYAVAAAALFMVWLETLTPEPDAAARPRRKEAAT